MDSVGSAVTLPEEPFQAFDAPFQPNVAGSMTVPMWRDEIKYPGSVPLGIGWLCRDVASESFFGVFEAE